MNLKHRVRINMTDSDCNKQTVLRGGVRNISRRIVQWLFGENLEILVLTLLLLIVLMKSIQGNLITTKLMNYE